MLCNTAQHCETLRNTVKHRATLWNTAQDCTTQDCPKLGSMAHCCTTLWMGPFECLWGNPWALCQHEDIKTLSKVLYQYEPHCNHTIHLLIVQLALLDPVWGVCYCPKKKRTINQQCLKKRLQNYFRPAWVSMSLLTFTTKILGLCGEWDRFVGLCLTVWPVSHLLKILPSSVRKRNTVQFTLYFILYFALLNTLLYTLKLPWHKKV